MNPLAERRRQDLAKIQRLCARAQGKISLRETIGTPPSDIVLQLNYKTAPSPQYPQEARDTTRVRIVLGARYPFQEPAVDILDPVFNPNVYPSGRVCLGTKWLATETLDLIVLRVAKILTFDSDILNDRAPANMEAAYWYKAALAARPEAFPTEKIAIESEIPASKPAWKGVGS